MINLKSLWLHSYLINEFQNIKENLTDYVHKRNIQINMLQGLFQMSNVLTARIYLDVYLQVVDCSGMFLRYFARLYIYIYLKTTFLQQMCIPCIVMVCLTND